MSKCRAFARRMWIPAGIAVLASLVLVGVCYSRKSECDREAAAV